MSETWPSPFEDAVIPKALKRYRNAGPDPLRAD